MIPSVVAHEVTCVLQDLLATGFGPYLSIAAAAEAGTRSGEQLGTDFGSVSSWKPVLAGGGVA